MASTYQYWRLYFNGPTNGTSVVSIAEWNFYDGTFNVISRSGGTASASSTFSGDPASNAFDGNINNFWASNLNPSSGAPQWLQYQFTSAITVSFISITIRNDASWLTQSPTAFLIQGSPDGSTWTTIETLTGVLWLYGQGQTQQFDASTVQGYLRASQVNIEVTEDPSPNVRVAQLAVETIGGSDPNVIITQTAIEVLGGSNPNVLATQLGLEVLGGSNPNVFVTQLGLEIMYPYIQIPQSIMEFLLP